MCPDAHVAAVRGDGKDVGGASQRRNGDPSRNSRVTINQLVVNS